MENGIPVFGPPVQDVPPGYTIQQREVHCPEIRSQRFRGNNGGLWWKAEVWDRFRAVDSKSIIAQSFVPVQMLVN